MRLRQGESLAIGAAGSEGADAADIAVEGVPALSSAMTPAEVDVDDPPIAISSLALQPHLSP